MVEKPSEIIVRPSVEDDVSAMLAIYSHHIQRGLGEFDVEPLHPDDIKRRRKNMLNRRLPHLVANLARQSLVMPMRCRFENARPTVTL